ncbi:TPA: hypothetical protein PBQ65_004490 [Escherichia coli]|uniref:hypothetical protein n=1 Tax=Escherichia coli TaxID=562 RepID=UPI001F0F923F|nr:hypothetical protein [Escherichia coli]MCH4637838.1 hypothetical protein [Escherichia coli]HDD9523426.1 hypothetical protein [Escherichia coli]HDD9856026.1 hypothetical protein [Escherichia coli]
MKTIKHLIAVLAMIFAFNANAAPDEKYCQEAADITGTIAELVRAEAEIAAIDDDVHIGAGYFVNKSLKYGRMFAMQQREINAKKVIVAWAVTGGLEAYKGNPDPAVTMYEFCMKYDRDEFMAMSLKHYDNIMNKINKAK